MEQPKEREHSFKKFFTTLFGSKETQQQEEKTPLLEAPPAGCTPAEPVQPADPAQLPPIPDALSQLWQRWAGPGTPPVLSLAANASRPLPLTGDALEREVKKIYRRLDQDARARLLKILQEPEGDLEAQCWVYMAKNGLVAWAFLVPPQKSEGTLAKETIEAALQEEGVTTGIDTGLVEELYQSKAYFVLRPVAWGTPVVEGCDGKIVPRFQPQEEPKALEVDERGEVDYRAQSYVRHVQKGDVICDIVQPEPGTDGMRVDGTPIHAKAVQPAKVPDGSNTTLSEDGTQLVATMDGYLEFKGSVFEIKSFLDIPGDVDYSTGNVDFRGDVHIAGDVREGFIVRATGKVTIDGLVEAATVEASGDVIITKGVLGDNRALIKSRGTIRAKYLENCVAYAGDCIYADCIVSSQVYSDAKIQVVSGRGTVIGGTLIAAERIDAGIIGSQAGRKTEITLGILPYVHEEQRNNEIDLQAIHAELEELDKSLHYLENRGMDASTEKLAKLRLRKSVLGLKENKLIKRQLELDQQIPDLSKCRLSCGTLYPITILTVGESVRTIEQTWTRCTVIYNVEDQEIQIS